MTELKVSGRKREKKKIGETQVFRNQNYQTLHIWQAKVSAFWRYPQAPYRGVNFFLVFEIFLIRYILKKKST